MSVTHFDVDENLKQYLQGEIYSFSIAPDTVSKIKYPQEVEVITIKHDSTINQQVLDCFPNLKLLITRTVGTDHIDLGCCEKRKILLENIPDYGSYNIAEHTMALLLAAARNIVAADKHVRSGKFSYHDFIGIALKGKSVGVIGTGKIGMEFIKRAKAFEMRVLAYDSRPNYPAANALGFEYSSLTTLLGESDFITLHIPLVSDTYHLLSDKELELIKDGAVLVNTSRGAIIDTNALCKHIKRFKAVCLDVLEDEKNHSKNNPLLAFTNIIATPHIAFYTDDSIKRIAEETNTIIENYYKRSTNNYAHHNS